MISYSNRGENMNHVGEIPEDVKQIIIVANKWWEAKPLTDILFDYKILPFHYNSSKKDFEDYVKLQIENYPLLEKHPKCAKPRLKLYWIAKKILVEVWCISDLMNVPPAHESSVEEKMRILPIIFNREKTPHLIIAFGTAAYPHKISRNGCVFLGTNTFVFNPFPRSDGSINPESNWGEKSQDRGIISTSPQNILHVSKVFDKLNRKEIKEDIEKKLLVSPLKPVKPKFFANINNLSIGVVNITKPEDYSWADPETFKKAKKLINKKHISSMETTHGIIRISSEHFQIPFIWISGIANRMGYYHRDVKPREYNQNFVAVHNAGITTLHLLSII